MVSFGEKAKIKKAGNLNYGRSYVIITTVIAHLCWGNPWPYAQDRISESLRPYGPLHEGQRR